MCSALDIAGLAFHMNDRLRIFYDIRRLRVQHDAEVTLAGSNLIGWLIPLILLLCHIVTPLFLARMLAAFMS
jgi:hypothetical protein